MKTKWLRGLILMSALAVPGFAQVSLYIGSPPPLLATKDGGTLPAPAMPGLTAIGSPMGIATGGLPDAGINRPTRELTGTIRTMTTSSKAGNCMKVIGTTTTIARLYSE